MRSIYRAQCTCMMPEPQVIRHDSEDQRLVWGGWLDVEFYLRCKKCGKFYSEEPNGWRSIKTAPRDGTPILAHNGDGCEIMEWIDGESDQPDRPGNDPGWMGIYAFPGRQANDPYHSEPQGQPTHWMPLPESPFDKE